MDIRLPAELRNGVITDALAWTLECIGKRGEQLEPKETTSPIQMIDKRRWSEFASGVRAAAYRTPYLHISDYMERWHFMPEIFGERVRLHHILRSDNGRDVHDHPWHFASLILEGGYTEEQEVFNAQGERLRTTRRLRAGDMAFRHAEHRHRLELDPGQDCWSLVFTSPKVRDWGFWTPTGFVAWDLYNQLEPAAA